jgi:DNA polymerase-1
VLTLRGDGRCSAHDPIDIHVARTASDLGHLSDWLAARRGQVLGLDAETNALDPWDRGFRMRTLQLADARESWVIVLRPWLGDQVRRLVRGHDYWSAWFSENDMRFVERNPGTAGSLRLEQDTPHLADAQVLLAYDEPRTVTAAKETVRTPTGQFVKAQLPRGLKDTSRRLLSPVLSEVDALMLARFKELAPRGQRTDKAAKAWGFANIPDDDELYLTYAGLDPLMEHRLWVQMEQRLRARGQWKIVAEDLALQWHIDRFTFRGMPVDPPYARWLDQQLQRHIDEQAVRLAQHGIEPSGQGPKVAEAFKALGVHRSSYDKVMLKEVIADTTQPEVVRALATSVQGARKATKFRGAYVKPILASLDRDGRVHCSMRAIGTITGRNSAARMALQQLPKKDTRVRAAFAAPHGWLWVSCDMSQGEPRVMAARSGDLALRADIEAGDFNSALAARTYGDLFRADEGKIAGTASYLLRNAAKVAFLAWCYGAGKVKIAEALDSGVAEAAQIIGRWTRAYPDLAAWRNRLNAQPAVVLESGRVCPLWDKYVWNHDGQLVPTSEPSRKALNYDTQGTQADLLRRAVHLLVEWGWSWALAFLIHDEILMLVPEAYAEQARQALAAALTFEYKGMPFLCEATIDGRTWLPQPADFDPSEIIDTEELENAA